MNGRASTSVRLIYAHKQTHTSAPRSGSCKVYTYTRRTQAHRSSLHYALHQQRIVLLPGRSNVHTVSAPESPFLSLSLSPSPPLVRSLALTPMRIGAAGCTTRAHVRYTHLLRTDEVTHSRREGEGGGRGAGWEAERKRRIAARRERAIILARREDGISVQRFRIGRASRRFPPLYLSRDLLLFEIGRAHV